MADPAGEVADHDQRERPAAGDVVGRRREVEDQARRGSRARRRTRGRGRARRRPRRAAPGWAPRRRRRGARRQLTCERPRRPARSQVRTQRADGGHQRLPSGRCSPAVITERSLSVSRVDDDADEVERGEVDVRARSRACVDCWRGVLETPIDRADRDARRRTARRCGCPRSPRRRPWPGSRCCRRGRGRGGRRRRCRRGRAGSRPPCSSPRRPPTTDSWSTISSTVAVRPVGAHHPADETVVVEHGHVGMDAGAGARVDRDGAARTTGPGPSRPPGPARARSRCASSAASRPSSSAARLRSHGGRRDLAAELRSSRPRAGRRRARSAAGGAEEVGDRRERAHGGRGAVLDRAEHVADGRAQRVERGAGRRRGRRG